MGPLSRMAALCRHMMWPGLRLLRAVAHLLHMSRVSPGRLLTRLRSDASREQIRDCSPGRRLHLLPRSDIRPGTRRAGAGAGSGDAGESGEGPGRGRPAQKQGCWRWMDTPLSLLCALCLWPGRAGQCPSQAHKQNPWAQGECPLPEMPALLIRFLSITLYAPLCPGGAAHPSLL